MEWTEITSADDDSIGDAILAWSGHKDLWDKHQLDYEHNFVSDVLEWCDSAWIDAEEWDGGVPGMSGNWYTVSTSDPERLKAEILARITQLIAGLEQPNG